MRAILTNFGTTGDVEPFIALAAELHRCGHEPVLALSPYYEARVARLGLAFQPIGPDLQKAQSDINVAMINTPELFNTVESMQALCAPVAQALPLMYEELSAACRGADVLISGPMQPAARMVHELTGIPFVAVYIIYLGSRGILPLSMLHVSESFINPFRAQLGLPPIANSLTSAGGPGDDADSPHLNLYAVSRHVVPPGKWPSHHHMTGYFFLDHDGWQPDPGLVEFLAAGPPPVVIGFGSMTHVDSTELTDLILEAIRIAGCRAIMQQGWSGLGAGELPAGVYAAGFVPHRWLFPRAACVAHHSATGTTAATFRAGIPGVYVPHAYEHPLNAQVARELGCAGPAIPYPQLTAKRLGEAIAATLATPRYYEAAAALGEKIRAEQGVQRARQLIEQLVQRIGLHQEAAAPARRAGAPADDRAEKIHRRKQYQQQQRARSGADRN